MNSQEHAHGIIVRAENSRNARMLSHRRNAARFLAAVIDFALFTETRLIKSPAEHLIYAIG